MVAELITRINFGLLIGSFEMDWSDGELRIRTAMPLEEGDFTDKQLEHLFYGNLALANRYLAGVYGAAFGNVRLRWRSRWHRFPARRAFSKSGFPRPRGAVPSLAVPPAGRLPTGLRSR